MEFFIRRTSTIPKLHTCWSCQSHYGRILCTPVMMNHRRNTWTSLAHWKESAAPTSASSCKDCQAIHSHVSGLPAASDATHATTRVVAPNSRIESTLSSSLLGFTEIISHVLVQKSVNHGGHRLLNAVLQNKGIGKSHCSGSRPFLCSQHCPPPWSAGYSH